MEINKREFEVQINRVHAGAPYNCAAFIPSVWCESMEEVINLPEMQELINKTFGKRLIVHVIPVIADRTYFACEVTKKRAVADEFTYKTYEY